MQAFEILTLSIIIVVVIIPGNYFVINTEHRYSLKSLEGFKGVGTNTAVMC